MGVSRKQSTPNFLQNEHFLAPKTHGCISGGKFVFRKIWRVFFLETSVLRFDLLPYYRQIIGDVTLWCYNFF